MKQIVGQVLMSTSVDSQGERWEKTDLETVAGKMPSRMALHQDHEMTLDPVGWIENFRVEPDDDGWVLLGDVTLHNMVSLEEAGGFSFSITQVDRPASRESRLQLFLPLPYYRNTALYEELSVSNPDVTLGRWVKKSLTPAEVGLIMAGIYFVFGPAWKKVYDEKVAPFLATTVNSVLKTVNAWTGRRPRIDVLQLVQCSHYERQIAVYLIPEAELEPEVVYGVVVREAIEQAEKLIESSWLDERREIRRIVFAFDQTRCCYDPLRIEYADSTVKVFSATRAELPVLSEG